MTSAKGKEWRNKLKSQVGQVGGRIAETLAGGANGVSREFFLFLNAVGNSSSKEEEDRLVREEVATLKRILSSAPPKEKMKEYVLRLLYCEMLGHEVEFGYVHALTLTQSLNILEKKVGYLAVASFLHQDHPLMIMVVNSFRRDLENDNFLIVCAALTTMAKLLNTETVPTVVSIVIKLLNHPKDQVRKRAVTVLHACWKIQGTSLDSVMDRVRRALCDQNPSVMIAALNMFDEMIDVHGRERYMDLISSFVSILKQVVERRLPLAYSYHQIPAPWVQIQLLQILAKLAHKNESASQHIYEVLKLTMKEAESGIAVGFAIMYECVRTAASIHPNAEIFGKATTCIARFLSKDNRNLRCMGISGLSEIVRISPSYASEHQVAVLDCLEDRDETLQKMTLELLYTMTTPRNVVIITEKMIKLLRSTKDKSMRSQLIKRIADSAERHAPSFPWFVETMKTVFFVGGESVDEAVLSSFYRVLERSSGSDSVRDNQLRVHALKVFQQAFSTPNCPLLVIEVAGWIMGRFAHLSPSLDIGDVIVEICTALELPTMRERTRAVLITALWQLIAREPSLAPDVSDTLYEMRHSKSFTTQQIIYDTLSLLKEPTLLELSLEGEDELEVDAELTFLNAYVAEALACGALPYRSAQDRADTHFALKSTTHEEELLRWEEYPQAKIDYDFRLPQPGESAQRNTSEDFSKDIEAPDEENSIIPAAMGRRKQRSVWSSKGYSGTTTVEPAETRPVYSNFPTKSKYSTTEPSATKKSSEPSTEGGSKKEKARRTKREREAAALFGSLEENKLFSSPPEKASPPSTPPNKVRQAATLPERKSLWQQQSYFNFLQGTGLPLPSDAQVPECVKKLVGERPVSNFPPCLLASNDDTVLSYFTVKQDYKLLLVLLFNAQQEQSIQIEGRCYLSDALTVRVIEGATEEATQGFACALEEGMGAVILEASVEQPSLPLEIAIQFRTQATEANDDTRALIRCSLFDFMQPQEMTTKEYSAEWKQIKASQRAVMPHTFRTIDDGLNFLKHFLSFSVVQVIGTEAICAASGWSQSVLCHCKPADKQLHFQLTFKCTDEALVQSLLNDFYVKMN